MAKQKSGDGSGKLLTTVATTAAVFVARKLVTAGWTRATGKTPPTDPSDPHIGVGEALVWAAIVGGTIEATRLFTARATTHRARAEKAAAEEQ